MINPSRNTVVVSPINDKNCITLKRTKASRKVKKNIPTAFGKYQQLAEREE